MRLVYKERGDAGKPLISHSNPWSMSGKDHSVKYVGYQWVAQGIVAQAHA